MRDSRTTTKLDCVNVLLQVRLLLSTWELANTLQTWYNLRFGVRMCRKLHVDSLGGCPLSDPEVFRFSTSQRRKLPHWPRRSVPTTKIPGECSRALSCLDSKIGTESLPESKNVAMSLSLFACYNQLPLKKNHHLAFRLTWSRRRINGIV